MALPVVNRNTVMATLVSVCDMPTIASEYPEIIDWFDARIRLDQDMLFQTVVVSKATGAPYFAETGDRREALLSWLLANPDA